MYNVVRWCQCSSSSPWEMVFRSSSRERKDSEGTWGLPQRSVSSSTSSSNLIHRAVSLHCSSWFLSITSSFSSTNTCNTTTQSDKLTPTSDFNWNLHHHQWLLLILQNVGVFFNMNFFIVIIVIVLFYLKLRWWLLKPHWHLLNILFSNLSFVYSRWHTIITQPYYNNKYSLKDKRRW